ncbi:MAG: RICIN domain-containing protein [Coriobacteriales bacterium]|nr:RICIN domain-containing protein [Coriobacteriales bacterium]
MQPNYVYTLVDGPSDAGAALVPNATVTPATGADTGDLAPFTTTINDPYAQPTGTWSYGWWLQNVKAFDAWDLKKVEGTVTVAIIDTGVHLAHDDLKDNILTSLAWDAVSGQPLASVGGTGDVDGHGTHVAGIAAARANNGKLVAGVSYNANILPIKVFSADAQGNIKGETADVVKAYDYIMERNKDSAANVRIVNLSIGGPVKNTALHNKIIAARSAGILTVAAAGNSSTDAALYPADYPEVISVVAVDRNNQRASFSNYGSNKDLAAPGTEVTGRSGILSTYSDRANPGDNTAFDSQQGTSMAAPIVSGTAALLFAENPALTPKEVQQILCSTATDLGTFGKDSYYGYGLVNAKAALDSLQPDYTPFTVTLNANGGSVYPAAVSKDRDAPLGALPEPTRTGFHFEGWYTAPSNGTKATTATKLTGDASYYAHWEIDTYTVRFDANGGTVSLASFKRTYQAALGKLPTPRKTGFIFEGWYTGKVKGTRVGATTKATKDITYYAHWITDFNRVVVTIASAKNNGRVLDIKGASTARAALLQLNPKNTTPSQSFRLERVKGTTTYVIRNINSNKVLGISGGKATNRAVIRQYSANNSRAQRWRLVPAANNSYSIVSVLNEDMALGLTAGSAAKGTTIRLFKATGSVNQRFVLNKVEAPLANGIYTITSSVKPGKALSLAGGSTKNGTALQLAAPNKGAAQKFKLTYDRATGYYTIVNVRSGKALDVAGAGKKNGTKVQVYTSNRTVAQKWTIVKTKSGYTLYSACSGLVLDIAGKASANGAKAQTRTAKGTAAQVWMIRKA